MDVIQGTIGQWTCIADNSVSKVYESDFLTGVYSKPIIIKISGKYENLEIFLFGRTSGSTICLETETIRYLQKQYRIPKTDLFSLVCVKITEEFYIKLYNPTGMEKTYKIIYKTDHPHGSTETKTITCHTYDIRDGAIIFWTKKGPKKELIFATSINNLISLEPYNG